MLEYEHHFPLERNSNGQTIQVRLFPSSLRIALYFLLGITALDFIAQIPYNLHTYPGLHTPNLIGIGVFLLFPLALFLTGYILTLRGKTSGGWLLLTFLVLEFIGYLIHNLASAFLKDLPLSDPIFFSVSLIGYVSFIASFVYILIIVKYRHVLLFTRDRAVSDS